MNIDYNKKMVNFEGDELTIYNKISLKLTGCQSFKYTDWDVFCKAINEAIAFGSKFSSLFETSEVEKESNKEVKP